MNDDRTMIETDDLVIRGSVFEDCEFFADWESRPEVNRYLCLEDDHSYKAVVFDFVKSVQDPTKMLFTITKKPDDTPIGKIVLTKINHEADSLNLTRVYIADQENRRKGYAEQAVRAILEYAFINLHMERVAIDRIEGDTATENLSKKLGSHEEGIMRHAGKREGKYVDFYRCSLLRAEYYNKIHDR